MVLQLKTTVPYSFLATQMASMASSTRRVSGAQAKGRRKADNTFATSPIASRRTDGKVCTQVQAAKLS